MTKQRTSSEKREVLWRLSFANILLEFREQPSGGLFSKLVMPRKQCALCSPQDDRSSDSRCFFLRLNETQVTAQFSNYQPKSLSPW